MYFLLGKVTKIFFIDNDKNECLLKLKHKLFTKGNEKKYAGFHWGKKVDKYINIDNQFKNLTKLGIVTDIEYISDKNDGNYTYIHKFTTRCYLYGDINKNIFIIKGKKLIINDDGIKG